MKATFDHSVKVLIAAYLNDTLQHTNCHACAVGNLIADANGWKLKRQCWDTTGVLSVLTWEGFAYEQAVWADVFVTEAFVQEMNLKNYRGIPKAQIDSTGYTVKQLARIEYAFETADDSDDWMYNGLVAVINVLASIHEVDMSIKQSAIKALSAAKDQDGFNLMEWGLTT